MTPAEFRAAEQSLGGLSRAETARLLGVSETSVAGYRRGDPIPQPVAKLMRLLAQHPDLAREVEEAA